MKDKKKLESFLHKIIVALSLSDSEKSAFFLDEIEKVGKIIIKEEND